MMLSKFVQKLKHDTFTLHNDVTLLQNMVNNHLYPLGTESAQNIE